MTKNASAVCVAARPGASHQQPQERQNGARNDAPPLRGRTLAGRSRTPWRRTPGTAEEAGPAASNAISHSGDAEHGEEEFAHLLNETSFVRELVDE